MPVGVSRARIAALIVLTCAVAVGCSYLANSMREPARASGSLHESASVRLLVRGTPPKKASDRMHKSSAVAAPQGAVVRLQRRPAPTSAESAGGVVAAAVAAPAIAMAAPTTHAASVAAAAANPGAATDLTRQPPEPAARSSWWPLLAAAMFGLLMLLAWRRRSGRRSSRRAMATSRAITWSGVSAPAVPAREDGVDFGNASWPLPSVAVAMDMDWVEVPLPASVPAAALSMRHDTVRAVDSRKRAIDGEAARPIALQAASPAVAQMTYSLSVAPESLRAAPEPVAAPIPTDLPTLLAEAEHWLTANQPDRALEALAPVLANGDANGEAWTVAGWSWWRIGRDQPGQQLEAATEAASAFRNALRVEPERANLLSRMIARCHQMRARHEVGGARVESLDAAIAVYDQHLQGRDSDDAIVLEWCAVLFERAIAAPHGERGPWLARSERIVEQRWGRTVEGADEPVQWLWINLLLARASLVELRPAELLHARAASLLRAGITRFDGSNRDAWLTRLIDAERALAQRLTGAARITRLRAVQAGVETLLATSHSIAPLRAWIGLLGDWAASLHGGAAQEKLKEAEPLFARIEALSPDDGAEARFARAYYLRLRSTHEFGASRWQTLEQAQSLLASIAPGQMPDALLDLESAELHLAQAGGGHGDVGQTNFEHCRHAAALAESAAQAPENEARALLCAVTAMVAMARSQRPDQFAVARMKALSTRLLDLAPTDAAALRVVASMQLALDDPQAASELCAAAWRAGAARAELLPIWREADSRWAQALGPSGRDPHWQRLHQGMRMANSTL